MFPRGFTWAKCPAPLLSPPFWSRHRIFSTNSALAQPCSSSVSFRRWSSRNRRRSSRISVPGWSGPPHGGRDGFTMDTTESRPRMDSPDSPSKNDGLRVEAGEKMVNFTKKKTVVNSSGWIEAPKSLMGEMMQKNNIGLNMIEWGFTTHKHKPNHGWSWGMQASRMWLSWGAVIELANRKVEDPWSKRKWCMTKNSRNAYMNKPRGHKRHNNGNVPYATRHGLSTGKHEALEHLGTGNKLMCLGLLTTYVLPAAMPDLKCMVICWDPSFGKPPSY